MSGPDDALPRLPPAEAIDYLRGKGYKIGFAWQDVWQEEHARAFTVAKAMSRDLLETIRAAVDKALANGETLEQFRSQLTPILQAKGWWGRKSMIDPATGQARTVQLGSPRRLGIIYETNLRMAQAAGRWAAIQRTKHALPYLRYTAVMDERTRPEHREWHGTILPVDDPWWDTHYPPCGWNCRCTTIQLDAASIAERGWRVDDQPPPADPPRAWTNPRTGEVIDVPAGIDPGFGYNPGKAWLDGIQPSPMPEPPGHGAPPKRPRAPRGGGSGADMPSDAPKRPPAPRGGGDAALPDDHAEAAPEAGESAPGTPSPDDGAPPPADTDRVDRQEAETSPAAPPIPPAIERELLPVDVTERDAVDAFVEGAGGSPGGAIVTDPAGWSLPIGPGWFHDAGGALVVPVGARRRVLRLVGRALREPYRIGWRWIVGADGTRMPMRRYLARVAGLDIAVDVGRAGWRFATSLDAGFDLSALASGDAVWRR